MFMASETVSQPRDSSHVTLARNMGLFSLIVYGVGDMVGSGIYGTIGRAAGEMGNAVWVSFLVSMVAAMLTGLSYANIASRYPRAAGAAYVTQRAFGVAFVSYVVGLTVTASGLTSMATSSTVFGNNLYGLTGNLGHPLSWVLLFLGMITIVNFWGIRESMWANLLCTVIEVGGLLLVIFIGMRYWGNVDYLQAAPAADGSTNIRVAAVFSTSVLTFFAFVGFEDMLNVAEEVKNPARTMPWGIICALCIVALIYIGVAITAVSVVDSRVLAKADAPLAAITSVAASWLPGWVYKFITLFAVANTVLINYIMGSRLLYGMSRQKLLPSVLGKVHHRRQTPHVAILTLLVLVLGLVMMASSRAGADAVKDLGKATGLLLLTCFSVLNAALIVLKLRPGEAKGSFEVPIVVPVIAVLINLTLVVTQISQEIRTSRAPWIALGLIALIVVLYLVMRPKGLNDQQFAAVSGD